MNKVIIAGSINMDIVALTKRHPKIGETVFGADLKYFPGGKGANQAVASAKLGAKTILMGKVGNDAFGEQLLAFLKEQKVDIQIFVEENVPTGTAVITVAEETSDNTIVVIPGANFKLTKKDIENINIEKGDILVSQFEIPIETIVAFLKKGKEIGTTNIFNPAPARAMSGELLNLIDVLILNETELSFISGIPLDIKDEKSILIAVTKLQNDKMKVVVTLGDKGVIAFNNGEVIKIEGRKVETVDTAGAGDCFVGAFVASLSESKSFTESLKFANIAASISVTRAGAGTSAPSLDEVISLT